MSPDPDKSIVIIVDDDASVREALGGLFQSVGLHYRAFASAGELLACDLSSVSGCLVLDIRLPGVSGFDLQADLASAGIRLPIIFMTGHGDIPMSVRAMKSGAVDFLAKPFRDQDLLDAVTLALDRDRKRRDDDTATAALRALFDRLTLREREVMAFVADGLMNKQIAAEMGVQEITVKVHRSHMMRKMGARSVADLVRMADMLGIRRPPPE